ncbi:23 kDa jasmonate-induced protein-like [Ziziphus jujuba]|uniref:23 kDa jasmonate-induced protein-like n=1 Tax=Ziziphus jujuba TaxID=326968 RepID=A0ABM3IFB9_ZIZJJ|nr:23 kDa jasmonate-induced protein-like [Ziziphus jujuba]
MAGNVFGNPITDDDVKILYPNVTEITPKLRADVAFRNISTNGRDQNAKNFVKNLKERYGNGISALCMIFNATGGTLTYSGNKDWHGHVYESPYPAKIQNGQWGAFLHVHPSWFAGSEAAVIYRGYNNDGTLCDWMLSWGIPYIGDNHAYTEIREGRHYETDHWDYIKGLLESQSTKHEDTWNGCYSIVTIGEGTSPEYVGIMSLEGVTTKK